MNKLRDFIYNQHDVVCNQKYGDNLPYSFHLKAVEAQGRKFKHLIETKTYSNEGNDRLVELALIAHDSIEDARLTYNDIRELGTEVLCNTIGGQMLAEIVYCVTDEKGRNRSERKNNKYYAELKANKLAVFVKLADLSANTLFSKLTGSSMYEKYKKEFPKFKEMLFIEEYEEFFNYVENL